MSKKIVSVLTAMTVLAPAVPAYAQTAASLKNVESNQIHTVNKVLDDVSSTINSVINSIDIEKPVQEEVTYFYSEAPVYVPTVYYETAVVNEASVLEAIPSYTGVDTEENDAYQIALSNYENALAAYNAASELVEITREEEVEIIEEVMDEEGNVTTNARTEIQTITETTYAGDVEAAQSALDAATIALEQVKASEVSETIVTVEEIDSSEPSREIVPGDACGDNAFWDFDQGNLTVSGTGSIYDYTGTDHAPWFDLKDDIISVTIQSGITRIGNYAFSLCSQITSVIIGDTVTEIGKYAFNQDFALTEIVIPNSVTTIETYAFNWCDHLETIEFGTGLTTIAVQAFYRCKALESVTLPSSLQTIGEGAFKECTGLQSITLNAGLKSINASAFSGCTALQSIEIPSSVTTLGSNIFSKCSSLMDINVQSSNTKYSSLDGVLYNKTKTTLIQCPIGKTAVTIPTSVTKVGNSAFYQCENLTSIVLPEKITSIGSSAFYQCNGLTEVVIPDSVSSIGSSVFSMCRNLVTVDLGTSITSIPSQAFYTCDKMVSVILPNTLTSISDNSFSKCNTLTDVYYRGKQSDWEEKGITIVSPNEVTMHYMADSILQSQHTLSLQGNVEVNFYLEFDEELLSDSAARVVFDFNNNTYEYSLSEGTPFREFIRFSVSVPSVMMTADIKLHVLSSKGDIGYTETYRAKDYCDNKLADSTLDPKLRTLLEALLNYGGYAQIQFNVNTDNLANADLEDTDVSDVTIEQLAPYESVTTGSLNGLSFVGSTLTLNSLTTIKHYFTVETGHTIDEFNFVMGDTVLTPIPSGSMYYVEIPNIASKDLDETYTVTVGDFSVQYSALSYAYTQLNKSAAPDTLKNVCRAVYKYNQAANAQFNS